MKRLLPALLLLAAAAFGQSNGIKVTPRARALHDSAIVIDTHADTPQRFVDEGFDIGGKAGQGYIDLDKIKAGNLGAEFFSIWVEPDFKGQYVQRAMDLIDSVYEQAARHPDRMMMAYSADDIVRAHREHKFAALMGLEGGHAINDDLRVLRDYYRLGVRYMTLTWSNTNDWADSSGDITDSKIAHHNGLTPFGKQVVEEMNRLGMMVDVSHVSDKTFWDAIGATRAPLIASHSSARALTNVPRNMTDDMLRAVAKNGGVVQVNFYAAFDDQTYRDAVRAASAKCDKEVEAAQEKYKQAHPGVTIVPYQMTEPVERACYAGIPRPPFKSLIDHIDHIAKVAGVDHVGLGSDFDGISAAPAGMDSAADLPKITQALLDRGYSADDIRKILGGNTLRVMREVERVSREMQAAEKAPQ